MFQGKNGYTLIEIITALTIVGLLALFSIPALMSNNTKNTANNVGKTETFIQAFVASVQNYEATTGNKFDLQTTTVNTISTLFGRYGNYVNVQPSGALTYFQMADGAIMATNVQLFDSGNLKYNTAASVQWNGTDADACGNFAPNECFYYDHNGAAKPPNKIGKDGDIIPLHFDPVTGGVKSLYAAQQELNPANANLCNYVSAYDVYTNMPGAATCP